MKNQLLAQFELHNRLYNNVLRGFEDKETNRRLHGDANMNHVKYLAGHLLNSQYGIALLVEVDVDVKWNDLFAGAGQSEAKDSISYPSIEEIKTEWNNIYDKIRAGIDRFPSKNLDDMPPAPLDKIFVNDDIFDNTIADLWAFLNHHQAYHIGQIGILRRGFGKKPMRYD